MQLRESKVEFAHEQPLKSIKLSKEVAMFWKLKVLLSKLDKRIEDQNREVKKRAEHSRISDQQIRDREREERIKLREFGQKFRCHVCGRPSKGPTFYEGTPAIFDVSGSDPYYDWNEPKDLKKCVKCGELTCRRHLCGGVCKNCA